MNPIFHTSAMVVFSHRKMTAFIFQSLLSDLSKYFSKPNKFVFKHINTQVVFNIFDSTQILKVMQVMFKMGNTGVYIPWPQNHGHQIIYIEMASKIINKQILEFSAKRCDKDIVVHKVMFADRIFYC